ncbi:MAG: CaiB/BaiF CoA-transferase family protein [Syntrophales bacterium]|nr:CaiB/BaiF CoA-transferase family protein [Syntrophales bacterium]
MGALDGLKILDFSRLLPGPFATLMLADLGADVLRIQSPSRPDMAMTAPPLIEGTNHVTAMGGYLGRNKRNLYLDMKKPEALGIIHKLIMNYDIILDQFRPGVMDRLGLGYEQCRSVNPKIIYCSLTGYGQTGPLRDKAGHDINYIARSGVMSYSGIKDIGPVLTGIQVADIGAGSLNSVIGILAAVIHREHTGEGQYVDIAMLDGAIAFNAGASASYLVNKLQNKDTLPKRAEGLLNGGSLYDFYETRDGRHLSVGSVEPQFSKQFFEAIGCPDLIAGGLWPQDTPQLKSRIIKIIKSKTLSEWMEIFSKVDACVEPVLNLQELLIEDEQARQREMVVQVPIPESAGKSVPQVGCPIKLSKCPPEYKHVGYPAGYHTEEVLLELGYESSQIKNLRESGVFG